MEMWTSGTKKAFPKFKIVFLHENAEERKLLGESP
jgi:hypothetical protein